LSGLEQFLINLLPVEHHRDAVADLPVLQTHYGVICFRHVSIT
jgi:hypothetical protein